MSELPDDTHVSLAGRALQSLTGVCARFPYTTLALVLGLAVGAAWYAKTSLVSKTSRADLIDPNAEYQKRWISYTEEFGDATDIIVVVEGEQVEGIKAAMEDIGTRIASEPKYFKNVLYKVDPQALGRKGLQYLSPEQLQMILGRLEEFGPVLRGHWNLFTLTSTFRGMRHQLSGVQSAPAEMQAMAAGPLVQQATVLTSSLQRFARNPADYQSPWGDLVPLDPRMREQAGQVRYLLNERGTMGFLKTQPAGGDSDFGGASPAINRLREIMAETQKVHADVKFGLTGIPVLESDEMRDSEVAMFNAAIISFIGCALLLVIGFRGVRYPLFAVLMLIVGTAWAFGFATLVVGHLNILSVSFTTMLIGIGIDFGVVFLIHYRDIRERGIETRTAVTMAAGVIGPGIMTAALTSSTSFFGAIFTDFVGVAELGIIASGGILLCTLCAFVMLPALLSIFDRRGALRKPAADATTETTAEALPVSRDFFSRINRVVERVIHRHPGWIACGALIGTGCLATYGLQVKYDYNLLHLQAKGLQSVEVQKRIFDQADGSLLFAVSLADSPQQALELKRKFEALPTVHHVEELASMFPPHGEEETQLLVQAIKAQLANLPPDLPQIRPPDPSRVGKQVEEFDTVLATLNYPGVSDCRRSIDQFLDLVDAMPFPKQMELLTRYQMQMTADLLARLRGLAAATDPDPVTVTDLPKALASRFVSPGGKWLLQVYPKSQIWDIEPLGNFIKDIRSVDPDATGTPLQTYEASREIKQSYEKVGIFALLAIMVLLLIDFRNLSHSLLAMLPPFLGAIQMFGILGLLGVDLNPANLIVLPLIIGLGVDGGIHVMHDYRMQMQTRKSYAPSSSMRIAILLNATTTMVGFGSMMIAAHRGLYSLGLVLTVGVGTAMFVSAVILPALLLLISGPRDGAETEAAPVPRASHSPAYNLVSADQLLAAPVSRSATASVPEPARSRSNVLNPGGIHLQ